MRELGVITQCRVRVQRQVVGDEVDVGFGSGDARVGISCRRCWRLRRAKITVVYKQRIGVPIGGGIDHGLTCCDSAGNSRYTVPALDLQSIRGIIFEL